MVVYISTHRRQGSPRHTCSSRAWFSYLRITHMPPGQSPRGFDAGVAAPGSRAPRLTPDPPKPEQEQPGRRRLNNGSAAWGRRRAGTVTSAGHKLRPVSEGLREPKLSSSRRGGCSVRSVSPGRWLARAPASRMRPSPGTKRTRARPKSFNVPLSRHFSAHAVKGKGVE